MAERILPAVDDYDDVRDHRHVAQRLDEQVVQARRWRDLLCAYFYDHSGIPDQEGRVPADDSSGHSQPD